MVIGVIAWSLHYAALIEYDKEFGHCNVPCSRNTYSCTLSGLGEDGSDYKYDGRLGHWLSNQRDKKRGRARVSPLLPDQEAKLQKLVDAG